MTNPQTSEPQMTADDLAAMERLVQAYQVLCREMGKVVIGQNQVVRELLICIFARGHAILEGVPGLAKTLMVSTLARCLKLDFARIQFTPDLMPSDITGTELIQEDRATGRRELKFLHGPLFANFILADEINRTPPKTQSALLEAMQERQVTAGGHRMAMKEPFFVLATQNPIEQEGTYPLPEAQQDRFMFKILVGYPTWKEELEIVRATTAPQVEPVHQVLEGETILAMQQLIRRIPAAPHVLEYAMRLVRATRVGQDEPGQGPVPDFVREYVSWGAGPRACQFLVLAGKVQAALEGRCHVSTQDIASVALPVLRHRLVTNYNADAEGFGSDRIIARLLETIPPHEGEVARRSDISPVLKK